MTETASPEEESDLCATCGMCCNGVLFYSVRIQPGESAKELLSAGMKLHRKKGVYTLLQPCPAFCGTHCNVYDLRPQRCRAFECRQLRLFKEGAISRSEAGSVIDRVQVRVAEVKRLLVLLGDRNEKRSLTQRYELVCDQILDPVWDREALTLRGQLHDTMRALEADLALNFRVEDAA